MNQVSCKQIHSDNIYIVKSKDVGQVIPNCDGLVTNLKNLSLNISTADCLPISLRDDVKKVVAIIHAGWRGTKKGISIKIIELLSKEFGSNPKDIKVKIGPSIDKNNYLVRLDVYRLFKKNYSKYFEKLNSKQWKFDLKGINIEQLISTGVCSENIEVSKTSTFLDNKYPSYRRDGYSKGFVTSIMIN